MLEYIVDLPVPCPCSRILFSYPAVDAFYEVGDVEGVVFCKQESSDGEGDAGQILELFDGVDVVVAGAVDGEGGVGDSADAGYGIGGYVFRCVAVLEIVLSCR